MKNVRESSDSEFYYPDALFDKELLQMATYFEREGIGEKCHYSISTPVLLTSESREICASSPSDQLRA